MTRFTKAQTVKYQFFAFSGFLGFASYGFFRFLDWDDEEKREERFNPLNERMLDQVIEVLSELDIDRHKKLKFEFRICKESLDFEMKGAFNDKRRLIGLPTYFEFTNEIETDLIKEYQNKFPKFANLNNLEFKKLFVLDPDEFNYAIAKEIFLTIKNYKYVESTAIMVSFYSAVKLVYGLGGEKLPFAAKASIAFLLSLIGVTIFYYVKPKIYEMYALKRIIDTKDINLLESGLKYLNKRIQIEQLRDNDENVKILKNQFNQIKLALEELKNVDHNQKSDKETDDSDKKLKSELAKTKQTLAETYTPNKTDALI